MNFVRNILEFSLIFLYYLAYHVLINNHYEYSIDREMNS